MPVSEVLNKKLILNQVKPEFKGFWECWSCETHRGRQVWKFALPDHLKGIVQGETDWQKPEVQEFLTQMRAAFVYDKKNQAHSSDLLYRTYSLKQKGFQPLEENISGSLFDQARSAAKKGFQFYEGLQNPGGNWPGDYGGPLFLQPGMVIVSYLTKHPIPEPYASLCKQYMLNMQNEDGGWGLHIEGKSTMLGTVLQYVALRILG